MISLPKKELKSDWIDIPDSKQRLKIDYPTGSQHHELQELSMAAYGEDKVDHGRFLIYARKYLKYTIKGWEGVETECKIVRDELEDSLWYGLTSDIVTTQSLYLLISKHLEWNVAEKKS